MKPTFRFKQFIISDDGCGQKLSTDAVLLGAYAKPPQNGQILDIGSGCGILALMMAQQSAFATIDAVETNIEAASQAQLNFDNSKWADRITIHHTSVQEYSKHLRNHYDCIISNPPYFQNQLKSTDEAISQAKHTNELDFTDLCICVSKLLKDDGLFWVILPASEKQSFLNIALQKGLFCKKLLSISDKEEKPAIRNIFCLSKEISQTTISDNFVIRDKNDQYTRDYIDLTKDYYL